MKLNHFLPISCVVCRYNVAHQDFPICSDCLHRLQDLLTTECKTCGRTPSACTCPRSDNHRFAFFYGDPTSQSLIYLLKTDTDKRVMEFIVRLAVNVCGLKPEGYDAVAYVPRSKKNLYFYGVDQARELAKAISAVYDIPVIDCIRRVGGREQKLLSRDERMKNMKNSFMLKEDFHIEKLYKKILLVDDVYTTGATIKTCASLLRGRVSEGVVVFTLAKTNILK